MHRTHAGVLKVSEVPDDITVYLEVIGIKLEETPGGLLMHCENLVSQDQQVIFMVSRLSV